VTSSRGDARRERGEPARLEAVPSTDSPPDAEELLARVALGDEHAFEQLYDVVAARVYGLVRRILRDPAQAEEVAQEVLVEVWRTSSRFDASKGSAICATD
jgi:RNA polymerase sigma-70 factor, ECF subfamily